ncbi:MAG TPA: GrrA/OscA1 family cyclophane-containing rSAM-modified RiPP [Acetobacteraceae bacterium]|jgi:rSAM-associated Gly-rich repeat protein|nr:GrrA/OscA1 family cyclophane-containing rSAM-modified RiPP [Acetobacteraceae bacterium]
MSRYNRYLQFVTALLPAGVFGLSVALAPSAAKATTTDGTRPRLDPEPDTSSVSSELQAIRDAVDQARAEMPGGQVGGTAEPGVHLAYWLNGNGLGWGNGGRAWGNGGYPGWANARPWGNGWGNGGWLNGGPVRPWGNAGWHNGGREWGNGGWHNWHNGFWRN